LNTYSIYEYNISFNKHFKKIFGNGFLQNDGDGTSERASEMAKLIGYLPGSAGCKQPKN